MLATNKMFIADIAARTDNEGLVFKCTLNSKVLLHILLKKQIQLIKRILEMKAMVFKKRELELPFRVIEFYEIENDLCAVVNCRCIGYYSRSIIWCNDMLFVSDIWAVIFMLQADEVVRCDVYRYVGHKWEFCCCIQLGPVNWTIL